VADIFQEVQEDLRRDKALAFWKKYQNYIFAAALLAVAATAAISGWRTYSQHRMETAGTAYLTAMQTFDHDPKAAAAQFDALASGGSGFAVLARFQQANVALKAGDKAKAAQLFTAISSDSGIDKAMRDMATVLAAMTLLDIGKPADAAKLVQPLTGDNQPYRFSALDIQGQAALASGDRKKAKDIYTQLKQLGALPNAPRDVETRAGVMLSRLQD
jgi:hypothetical protein